MLYLNTLTLSSLNALTEEELNGLLITDASQGSPVLPSAMSTSLSPANIRSVALFALLLVALLLGT